MKTQYKKRLATSATATASAKELRSALNGPFAAAADSKEVKLQHLALLSITPVIRTLQRWWLQRAERHYLICADVEQQRAREAQMNVAYYQKRAALARSAQI